jgi:transposase
VIHNFNADGFTSLYPKYAGGRPRTFNLPERREIKKIAKSKPVEHGLPFSTWSLSKLADFLVAEGVVDDISHEGLRVLLRDEGVSFQRIKTWKTSKDPDYAVKKARVEHLYAIADGEVIPDPGEPTVVFCLDEFGPLNLMPHPGPTLGRDQRQEQGARPRTAPPAAGDLQPQRRGPTPVRRIRPDPRPPVRARQAPQDAHPVPGVLPLSAHPLPGRRADRDRV